MTTNGTRHDHGDWVRWFLGLVVTVTLMLASGAMGWVMNHEKRVTTLEGAAINGVSEADKQLKHEMELLRKEYREDVKEIKGDIKLLLERRR